jgi:Calreticulin family
VLSPVAVLIARLLSVLVSASATAAARSVACVLLLMLCNTAAAAAAAAAVAAQIMFGPDICGQLNARTHVIFHSEAKDDNLLVKHDVRVEKDNLTHVYTLHVKVHILL